MYRYLIKLLLPLLTLLPAAHAEQEFLRPDQAFVISAEAVAPDRVAVHWRIADGYYLYQSKFRFVSETAGVEFGEPTMPPAETKHDPIFGEVQIYRNDVTLELPLSALQLGTDMLAIKARSQGCADAGICYPPHTQAVLVALSQAADAPPPVDTARVDDFTPVGSAPPLERDPVAELAQLGASIGMEPVDDDILPPEEAFQFDASVIDASTLNLRWTIADGTYLYQDKVKIALRGDGAVLGDFQLPAPDIKKDSIKPDGSIGDVAVYHHMIDLTVPLLRTATTATKVQLDIAYQGCADRGICYPPQKQNLSLDLPVAAATTAQPATAATPPFQSTVITTAEPATTVVEPLSEQDEIAAMIAGDSALKVIGVFFLIGLGLAFTPCVFPMIPILSGIITGQGRHITTRRAFTLSLVYVLAMAVTYTVAGVFAALAGENIQAALQNPIAISIFAAIFVALAMSMFGFYDIQLPSSLQSRVTDLSNKQHSGSLTGTAIMGLLSALIVGPCVAPPLAGALIYIGQSGDAYLGGAALFAMSLGMGAPLLAIGTSAGKLLPRAGAWMDGVKAVFGVVMLGMAIYLLERIISEAMAMLLWGMLLVVSAIYMGAITHLPEHATGWRKLWKGIGVAMLVYGAMFLIGVAADGRDTLQPLRGVLIGGSMAGESGPTHVTFKRVKTIADLQGELAAAQSAGRPVMLDFYADWCVYCKQMEKQTFPDAGVRAALDGFVLLQADVTDNDAADTALQQHIGIPAPPAMIFWGGDGNERKHLRLLGFMGPQEFASHVRSVRK